MLRSELSIHPSGEISAPFVNLFTQSESNKVKTEPQLFFCGISHQLRSGRFQHARTCNMYLGKELHTSGRRRRTRADYCAEAPTLLIDEDLTTRDCPDPPSGQCFLSD
jgi:hypothetical protein